VATLRWF